MVEAGLPSEDLVAAFDRLRSHWRDLFGVVTDSPDERETVLREVGEDLSVVTTAARISEEAADYVETAFRARLGDLGNRPVALSDPPGGDEGVVPQALLEAARALRTAFENLVRPLQQMELGDEILPEAGRDMRRSAARAMAFFHEVRNLDGPSPEEGPGPAGGSETDGDAARLPVVSSPRGGDNVVVPTSPQAAEPSSPKSEEDEESAGEAGPPESGGESRDEVIRRRAQSLLQSYDGRRKMIREDIEVQPPPIEAVEFLLRLGSG